MSFSPQKNPDNFLRKSKLNFWTKNEDFEQFAIRICPFIHSKTMLHNFKNIDKEASRCYLHHHHTDSKHRSRSLSGHHPDFLLGKNHTLLGNFLAVYHLALGCASWYIPFVLLSFPIAILLPKIKYHLTNSVNSTKTAHFIKV